MRRYPRRVLVMTSMLALLVGLLLPPSTSAQDPWSTPAPAGDAARDEPSSADRTGPVVAGSGSVDAVLAAEGPTRRLPVDGRGSVTPPGAARPTSGATLAPAPTRASATPVLPERATAPPDRRARPTGQAHGGPGVGGTQPQSPVLPGPSAGTDDVPAGRTPATPPDEGAAEAEGTTWSPPTTWQWAHHDMPSTQTADQFAEAAIGGATTEKRNGAFVLRRSADGDQVLVSFSGTRYQVRATVGGTETLLVDVGYEPTVLGAARVELRGDRLTARWGGEPVHSATLPSLVRLTGTGTRLAVWQDVGHAVTIGHAVTGDLVPSGDTPTAPQETAQWSSGASGDGVVDGSFGTWRGRSVEIAGTWNDNYESQAYQWSLWPGFELGTWQKDVDVAVGGIYKDRGETWAAAATGAYDARWREALTNLDATWGDRPGTLYIRFAHEFNGDWYPWSVTGPEAADFVASWKRFRALQLELAPRHQLVFCPNVETSGGLGLDWRTAFPGAAYVDVLSVDVYNQFPFISTAEQFHATAQRADATGAPAGLEAHRQFAQGVGRPFAISEWGSNADLGDSPVFVTQLHRWLQVNGGTGPGQVLYEVHFNPGYYGNGKFQLFPGTRQPLTSQEYARLWRNP